MKVKGILGLGKQSTAFYMEQIQKKDALRQDKSSVGNYLLYQTDFEEINQVLPDQFSVLEPKINFILHQIQRLGISDLLVPNITLHETLDRVDLPVRIYHPLKITSNYLQERSISDICIFGTLYTMNSGYIPSYFKPKNIKTFSPLEADQKIIDDFRVAVYLQKVSENQIVDYQNVLTQYLSESAVLIACTELSIFTPKENPSCIDMMDLQIQAFLK